MATLISGCIQRKPKFMLLRMMISVTLHYAANRGSAFATADPSGGDILQRAAAVGNIDAEVTTNVAAAQASSFPQSVDTQLSNAAHSIAILHPRNGGTVTAGAGVLLAPDVPGFDGAQHEVCWQFFKEGDAMDENATPVCMPDTAMRLMAATEGSHTMVGHLVRKAGQDDHSHWRTRVLASANTTFMAERRDYVPQAEVSLPSGPSAAASFRPHGNAPGSSPCNSSTWWMSPAQRLTARVTRKQARDMGLDVDGQLPFDNSSLVPSEDDVVTLAVPGPNCGVGWPGPQCTRFSTFKFYLYDLGWETREEADAIAAAQIAKGGAVPGTSMGLLGMEDARQLQDAYLRRFGEPGYNATQDWHRMLPAANVPIRDNLQRGTLDWMLAHAPSTEALAIYRVLRDSPLRSTDPTEACVKIALSDVQAANVGRDPEALAAARLALLPGWNEGAGHLVFSFGDHGLRYDSGRAMLAGSGLWPPGSKPYTWPKEWLTERNGGRMPPPGVVAKEGVDIVMPLPFYRCGWAAESHLHRFSNNRKLVKKTSERPVLLSFKGSVYGFPADHPASTRAALRRVLHNGQDVRIHLTCANRAPSCEPCEPPACDPANPPLQLHRTASTAEFPDCDAWTAEADAVDFDDLLLNSKFTAIVPGEGPHSYRLAEALAAGSIPVFMPGAVRPLEPFIRWDECALWVEGDRVPSDDMLRIVEPVLRRLDPAVLDRMQGACLSIFESSFSSLGTSIHAAFGLLAQRYEAAAERIRVDQKAAEIERRAAAAAVVGDATRSETPAEAEARARRAAMEAWAAAQIEAKAGLAPPRVLQQGWGQGPAVGGTVGSPAAETTQAQSVTTDRTALSPEAVAETMSHAPVDKEVRQDGPRAYSQATAASLMTPREATAAVESSSPAAGASTGTEAQPVIDFTQPSSRLTRVLASLLGPQGEAADSSAVPQVPATQPARALHFQPLLDLAASAVDLAIQSGLSTVQQLTGQALQLSVDAEKSLIQQVSALPDAVLPAEAAVGPDGTAVPAEPRLSQAGLTRVREELVRHSAAVLVPALRNSTDPALVNRLSYYLTEATDAWLAFLHHGIPGMPDKLHPSVRPALPKIYGLLSQVYGVLGHTRHAATAAHIVHLVTGDERATREIERADATRVRTSMVDLRASPVGLLPAETDVASGSTPDQPSLAEALTGTPFTRASIGGIPPFRLGRTRDDLRPALDSALLGGLGLLAHFTGPSPLSSPGMPGIVLPVVVPSALTGPSAAQVPPEYDDVLAITGAAFDHPTPHVLVSETLARVVAARLRQLPGFRLGKDASLQDFRSDAGLPAVEPGMYGPTAIVSMCAYPAEGPKATVLAGHSQANFRRYCSDMSVTDNSSASEPTGAWHGRGYDCYLSTEVLDNSRPPAWSKVPLTAAVLPSYAWVMWKDCDTYLMPDSPPTDTAAAAATPVRSRWTALEEVMQASLYARLAIGRVTAGLISELGLLDAVMAGPGAALGEAACAHVVPLGSAPVSLFWGEDGFMLNTGVWIARGGQPTTAVQPGQAAAPGPVQDTAGFGLRLLRRAAGEGQATGADGLSAPHLGLGVHSGMAPGGSTGPAVTLPPSRMDVPDVSARKADAVANATVSAMLDPVLRQTIAQLLDNRLWEQGTLLALAGAEHVLLEGRPAEVVSHSSAWAQGFGQLSQASVCGLPYPLGAHHRAPGYAVHPHSAWLPQRWFNGYPADISRVLTDGDGLSLHGTWTVGDPAVSFSGCTAYYTKQLCEQVFDHYYNVSQELYGRWEVASGQ